MRRSNVVVLVASVLAVGGCGSTNDAAPKTTTPAAGASAAAVHRGPNAPALALQEAFESVVRRVSPQIVQIETSQGLGSGIVFDSKGDIVTNAHVVGGARKVAVTVASGQSYPAQVVNTYVQDDLALVRAQGRSTSWPAATFADSSKLQVGEIVLAIGNPLGLRSSVTQGIISALGRTETEETGAILPSVIQTSAAINPGNSGGALVDLEGRVVGIPTLAAGSPLGGAAPGIGFAIPSNTVTDIGGQIATHGKVTNSHRAFLGVVLDQTRTGNGIVVAKVLPKTGAEQAGLRRGDVITKVDGRPTPTLNALASVLATRKPGQTVRVTVAGRRKATVDVKLGELPVG